MKAALAVIGGLAVLVGIIVGGYAVRYYTADVRGKVAANERIKANAEFRIQAYERFFNQCASVQSIEATLDASRQELETATTERERQRIRTNITALLSARAEAVNHYNADARKSYTAGQFRASDLPFELPVQMPEGGTQCVA